MRVCHVISGLATGGAEGFLLRLIRGTPDIAHQVVSLGPGGPVAEALRALVPVEELRLDRPSGRLRRMLRLRPRGGAGGVVTQGWMYHGNLAATLLSGGRRLAWGIRQRLEAPGLERPGTRIVIRAGAVLSGLPARIVYNSEASARDHERLGYAASRRTIIPNGFDLDWLTPGEELRREGRDRLALDRAAEAVLHLARLHPVKDHPLAVEALGRVLARRPDTVAIFAGRGLEAEDGPVADLERRFPGRVRRLGDQADPRGLLAASDALLLTSRAEAFPNVVGEAMAMEVPVVTTDVGDVRTLVGDAGTVVSGRDPGTLADAVSALLALEPAARRARGELARERIRTHFALADVAGRYRALWAEVAEA